MVLTFGEATNLTLLKYIDYHCTYFTNRPFIMYSKYRVKTTSEMARRFKLVNSRSSLRLGYCLSFFN